MLIFFICSLINVILSTLKTLIMIRAGRKSAIIVNAITYSFYTLVVKQLTEVNYLVAVLATFIANVIGVWLSYKIMDLFKKEKLWRITATLKSQKEKALCIEKLKKYNIGFVDISNTNAVDIYSYTKEESSIIKTVLDNYKHKYFIQEMNNKL